MKRKTKFVLGISVVLLATLGGLFWYYYVVVMNRTLLSAEALRLRRMQVAQLAEDGAFRFFFATNRNLEPGDKGLEGRFGNRRTDALTLGTFDTKVEPTLGIGMLINPTDWLQNEEIRLKSVDALEREQFVAKLSELVASSPRRSLLIVIHGYRETFPSALRKTAFVSHALDIDSPVLLFDWPGDQGSSLRGYRRASDVARESGAALAEALSAAVDEAGVEKIWVLANSMGAQVVAEAFSILFQDDRWADAETEIEDVVMTAPDVGTEEFNQQFKHEIAAMAKNLTVYVSSNDQALLASRLINRARRRGESSLAQLSPDQWDEAVAVASLLDPDSALVTLVDVTPVNRTRNFHNFSLETPEFFDDLFLRLTNDDTPQSRLVYPIKTPDGTVYWVLTRGH